MMSYLGTPVESSGGDRYEPAQFRRSRVGVPARAKYSYRGSHKDIFRNCSELTVYSVPITVVSLNFESEKNCVCAYSTLFVRIVV